MDSDQYVMQFNVNGTASIAERKVPANATSNFSVTKSGALEITITTEKTNNAKRYAVMDMKGQVISTGELNNSDTRVRVATTGSYIIKVGNKAKRINVR